MARLDIGNAGNDRYKLSFEAECGKVVCEVSLSRPASAGALSSDDKKEAALKTAKKLAHAFYEAIPES